MPTRRRSGTQKQAAVFAALGDATRLSLLDRLSGGRRYSIAALTEGTALTRQAVTKHLAVLERVRIVRAERAGRERIFQFNPQPIHDMTAYLELVSRQWDGALTRLQAFVEQDAP